MGPTKEDGKFPELNSNTVESTDIGHTAWAYYQNTVGYDPLKRGEREKERDRAWKNPDTNEKLFIAAILGGSVLGLFGYATMTKPHAEKKDNYHSNK